VKGADLGTLRRAAERVKERFAASVLEEFFGPTVTLVPALPSGFEGRLVAWTSDR